MDLNAKTTFIIPRAVVERSWAFLRDRGAKGHEGMLLWAGCETAPKMAVLRRLVIPAQTAIRTALGVCVAMDMTAQRAMPDSLQPGEEYLIRVHSHPREAFHSKADDANLVLSHEGAISIVVPDFCKNIPCDFSNCAVFQYSIGRGWRELSQYEIDARFILR